MSTKIKENNRNNKTPSVTSRVNQCHFSSNQKLAVLSVSTTARTTNKHMLPLLLSSLLRQIDISNTYDYPVAAVNPNAPFLIYLQLLLPGYFISCLPMGPHLQ
ncbi:hypothetical protein CI102_12895 [Trichoderma harzianum]|nr:hypothetical protein CI102_12895 [Trichoderma harzianum]